VLSDQPSYQQLEMVWPQHRLNAPPARTVPAGYSPRTYFKLGYIPYLYTADMPEHWRMVCQQLNWPHIPEQWRQADT
jgi:hypothetical protein